MANCCTTPPLINLTHVRGDTFIKKFTFTKQNFDWTGIAVEVPITSVRNEPIATLIPVITLSPNTLNLVLQVLPQAASLWPKKILGKITFTYPDGTIRTPLCFQSTEGCSAAADSCKVEINDGETIAVTIDSIDLVLQGALSLSASQVVLSPEIGGQSTAQAIIAQQQQQIVALQAQGTPPLSTLPDVDISAGTGYLYQSGGTTFQLTEIFDGGNF